MERDILILTAVVVTGMLAVAALAPAPGTDGTETVTNSFEPGEETWATGTDLPIDPNREGNVTVDWNISTTERVAAEGNRSGLFMIDGLQDDGTVWVEREIPVEPGQQYRVNMSAQAYSQSESFNVIAHMVMYAGLEPPREEEDFPGPGRVVTNGSAGGLRQPLAREANWSTYSFSWTSPVLEPDQDSITVATGMSVVWETRVAFPIDDIRVTAEPVGNR